VMFRDSAAEGDRLARLPKYVVRALTQHGLFRLWIPKRCGGFELDLPEALQIYEAAARLDGSIGWAVMIGSGGGLFAAYLDSPTASSIYARPESVVAGSGAPDGRAFREKGGYRVSGCWPTPVAPTTRRLSRPIAWSWTAGPWSLVPMASR